MCKKRMTKNKQNVHVPASVKSQHSKTWNEVLFNHLYTGPYLLRCASAMAHSCTSKMILSAFLEHINLAKFTQLDSKCTPGYLKGCYTDDT